MEDVPLSITLTADDDDVLIFNVEDGPAHGSLSGTPPVLTYSPDANYHGQDTFTFTASDGHLVSNLAMVTINIGPVNDPPVVEAGEDVSDLEGNEISFLAVVSDPDSSDTHSAAWDFGAGTPVE